MKVEALDPEGQVIHTEFTFGVDDAGRLVSDQGTQWFADNEPVHITIKEDNA